MGGWLRRHQGVVACAIALASVVLRWGVFRDVDGGPVLVQHRWDATDMHFFDAWARQLAAGDWLNREAPHPVLPWHRAIAARYFDAYPDDALSRAAAADPDPAAWVWNQWYGPGVYHQEPLYPYAIAATYALVAPDPRPVLVWQLVLGVLTNCLVWRIASRVLGEAGGLVAAVLVVLCAPLPFHELLLLRTALVTFETALLTWLGLRCFERPTPGAWATLGVAFGLGMLTNSTFVLFAPPLAAAFLWREHAAPRPALARLAVFACATVLVMTPVFVRNAIVGAPLASTSSVGALAFVCANTADFDPRAGFVASSPHVPAILHASGDRLLAAILPTLATHADVGSWVRQLGSKLAWAWRWYEIPNNENLYAYENFSPVLRWMPVRFGALAPLAIVGLALGLRRAAALAPLYAMALAAFAPLLVFYVLSRFRAPFLVVAIPFAALTLCEGARLGAARAWTRLGLLGLGVGALAVWTNRPLPADMPRIRPVDWTVPFATWYVPESKAAEAIGDWSRVVRVLADGLRHEPPFVVEIGTGDGHRAPRPEEAAAVTISAYLHQHLAAALEQVGDAPAAAAHRARTEELRSFLE